MTNPMHSRFTRDGAQHFLRDTLIRSMEGALFVLLSALFTLAGGAALLDGFSPAVTGEMTAAATAPTKLAVDALRQVVALNEAFTKL